MRVLYSLNQMCMHVPELLPECTGSYILYSPYTDGIFFDQ